MTRSFVVPMIRVAVVVTVALSAACASDSGEPTDDDATADSGKLNAPHRCTQCHPDTEVCNTDLGECECATSHERNTDGLCVAVVAGDPCDSEDCGAGGLCDSSTGEAICSCAPAGTAELGCNTECDAKNVWPDCGCSAQWYAKADFFMARKAAFWPAYLSAVPFYDHTGTEVRYSERLKCTLGDDTEIVAAGSGPVVAKNGNHGAEPGDDGMLDCYNDSTGWEAVPGPYEYQLQLPGALPAKRYTAADGCECLTPYYPSSTHFSDDDGHVCNDDSKLQLDAFNTGECERTADRCQDTTLQANAPVASCNI